MVCGSLTTWEQLIGEKDLGSGCAECLGTVATKCGSGVSCIVVSGYGTQVGGVLYILAQMWEQCCLRALS